MLQVWDFTSPHSVLCLQFYLMALAFSSHSRPTSPLTSSHFITVSPSPAYLSGRGREWRWRWINDDMSARRVLAASGGHPCCPRRSWLLSRKDERTHFDTDCKRVKYSSNTPQVFQRHSLIGCQIRIPSLSNVPPSLRRQPKCSLAQCSKKRPHWGTIRTEPAQESQQSETGSRVWGTFVLRDWSDWAKIEHVRPTIKAKALPTPQS